MPKPITPQQAKDNARKLKRFPPEVIQAFNELITENLSGTSSKFTKDAVLVRIQNKLPTVTPEIIYKNKWLDVEAAYEKKGWIVNYDKPGYNETYEATYEFRVKTKNVVDQPAS